MQDQVMPLDMHHVVSDLLILELVAVSVVVLWLPGLITSFALGGLIHILLGIAVIATLLPLISNPCI